MSPDMFDGLDKVLYVVLILAALLCFGSGFLAHFLLH